MLGNGSALWQWYEPRQALFSSAELSLTAQDTMSG